MHPLKRTEPPAIYISTDVQRGSMGKQYFMHGVSTPGKCRFEVVQVCSECCIFTDFHVGVVIRKSRLCGRTMLPSFATPRHWPDAALRDEYIDEITE
jgi:hypothetical protein